MYFKYNKFQVILLRQRIIKIIVAVSDICSYETVSRHCQAYYDFYTFQDALNVYDINVSNLFQ